MTLQEVIKWLKSDGWREFKHPWKASAGFYKSFDGLPECLCNEGKRKQIEIYLSEWELTHSLSFEVETCGEVKCELESENGAWVHTKIYGIPLTKANILKAVEMAKAQWTHAATKL